MFPTLRDTLSLCVRLAICRTSQAAVRCRQPATALLYATHWAEVAMAEVRVRMRAAADRAKQQQQQQKQAAAGGSAAKGAAAEGGGSKLTNRRALQQQQAAKAADPQVGWLVEWPNG